MLPPPRLGALTAVVMAVVCFFPSPVFASEPAEDFPPEDVGSGWVLVPFLAYAPETSLLGGFSAIYHVHLSPGRERPSTLQTAFSYSLKDQAMFHFIPAVYLDGDRYLLSARVSYFDFPDKFWGIGPDTPGSAEEDYTARTLRLPFGLQRSLGGGWFAKLKTEFGWVKMTRVEEGGLLDRGDIAGSDGGRVAGAGAGAGFDSRDNIFFPSRGAHHRLSVVHFAGKLGSEYDFTRFETDLRFYLPRGRDVLALQAYWQGISGAPPFFSLPQLGGLFLMRGWYGGRYRDRHLAAAQAEYRLYLGGRWGLAGFLSAGTVAPRPSDFKAELIRGAGGIGARYRFSGDQPINIRFDLASGGRGVEFYFTLLEAF